MLTIRLARIGRKNQPKFRIVLTDHTYPVKGKFIEIVGYYNPQDGKSEIKKERIEYWLKQGAKVSQTMKSILKSAGIKQNLIILNKKHRTKIEKKEEAKGEIKAKKAKKSEEKAKPAPEKKEEAAKKPEVKEKPKTPEQAKK